MIPFTVNSLIIFTSPCEHTLCQNNSSHQTRKLTNFLLNFLATFWLIDINTLSSRYQIRSLILTHSPVDIKSVARFCLQQSQLQHVGGKKTNHGKGVNPERGWKSSIQEPNWAFFVREYGMVTVTRSWESTLGTAQLWLTTEILFEIGFFFSGLRNCFQRLATYRKKKKPSHLEVKNVLS